MEVREVTVPLPDCPSGLSFGPVIFENVRESRAHVLDEVPVTLTPHCRRFLGIRWYRERYLTVGVFDVTRDTIRFHPTAPVVVEDAPWWRRLGFRLLTRVWEPAVRHGAHVTPDR
jgi:hypothetical protein